MSAAGLVRIPSMIATEQMWMIITVKDRVECVAKAGAYPTVKWTSIIPIETRATRKPRLVTLSFVVLNAKFLIDGMLNWVPLLCSSLVA